MLTFKLSRTTCHITSHPPSTADAYLSVVQCIDDNDKVLHFTFSTIASHISICFILESSNLISDTCAEIKDRTS